MNLKTTLVKIEGCWINPAHVACLASMPPANESKTMVLLAGGPSSLGNFTLKTPPDEVAAILIKAVNDANPTIETTVVNRRMHATSAAAAAALHGLAPIEPQL